MKCRTNGFQSPLHLLQITSWFVYGADIVLFSAFCLPLIWDVKITILSGCIFAISAVGLFRNAVLVTRTNPVDKNILDPPVDSTEMPYAPSVKLTYSRDPGTVRNAINASIYSIITVTG